MNYTIPKTRQQAIEIFDNLYSYGFTKYDMFIGALTECSDEEFKLILEDICNICDSAHYIVDCGKICKDIQRQLFSKRWNE